MASYLIIGLGRFGSALAQRLTELGNEVLAVDMNEEVVECRVRITLAGLSVSVRRQKRIIP